MRCSLGPRLLPRFSLHSRAPAATSAVAARSARVTTARAFDRGTWVQADRHLQLRANSFARRLVAARRSFAAEASKDKPSEEEKASEEKPSEEKPSDEEMLAQLQERRRKIEEVKRQQQLKSQKRMEEVRRKVDEQKRRREEPAAADAGGEKASSSGASSEATAAKAEATHVERLQKELEELTEKSRAKKHELLLALADFENNKKKFAKERETRRRSASANFARRMVDVYHDFEAMEAFKLEEEGATLSEACVALDEGVKLTRDLLRSAMEKGSVERFHADPGQPVVAARHEVVGSAPGDGSLPADSVAEVAEPGWILDPRSSNPVVLRKARVKTVGEAPAE